MIGTIGAVGGVVGAYSYFSSTSKYNVSDYSPNGPAAQRIASVTPYFPFKGIDRFYDIGGFLKDPEAFQLVVDVFVERYALTLECSGCFRFAHFRSGLLLHSFERRR